MRKIEKRAVFCLLLALFLFSGLCLFTFRFFTQGGDWASFASNRHLYSQTGELLQGTLYDRDGDILSTVVDDKRTYYDDATVRKATLHVVGDRNGGIGTGALVAFADLLSGYDIIGGSGQGSKDLTSTVDAYLNVKAYQALGDQAGSVMVYNYQTGEILCMVSTPTFDPDNPPDDLLTNSIYEGVYLNRGLSATFTPGSVMKTLTLQAAIDEIPDLTSRTWTCTGSVTIDGGTVTCPYAHGEMDIADAFACSCNGVFAQLAVEVGATDLTAAADKANLTSALDINGIRTAVGKYDLSDADDLAVGWSGVGQANVLMNPTAMMTYMGAIANNGTAVLPRLLIDGSKLQTKSYLSASTAEKLTTYLANNVAQTYGNDLFGGLPVCAKSGTAEVGGDKRPTAWFTGFVDDASTPLAFAVVVEQGGGGASTAGSIAGAVVQACANKMVEWD